MPAGGERTKDKDRECNFIDILQRSLVGMEFGNAFMPNSSGWVDFRHIWFEAVGGVVVLGSRTINITQSLFHLLSGEGLSSSLDRGGGNEWLKLEPTEAGVGWEGWDLALESRHRVGPLYSFGRRNKDAHKTVWEDILPHWLPGYTHMEGMFERDRTGNIQKTWSVGEGGHEEFKNRFIINLINAGKVTEFGKVNLKTSPPWSTKSGFIYPGHVIFPLVK